jgi:hypothetical protein
MDDRPLTPLGQLLERARVDDLHISGREAARRSGISEGRWRHIVRGSQARAGGDVPVTAPATTIVSMALAVEVDPAEALKAAGFDASEEDIAAMVQRRRRPKLIERPVEVVGTGSLADEIERIRNLRGVSPEDKIRMVKVLVDLHEERAAPTEGN